MALHKTQTLDDIHALTAREYADITARDADSDFNTSSDNINKLVKVSSPISYYLLVDTTPTWESLGSTISDEFTELVDTPNTYVSQGGLILRVNSGETAVEFTDTIELAGLDLTSTSDVLRLPRLTTTERDALTALNGMVIYNTDTLKAEVFDGTDWEAADANGDVVGPSSSTDNAIARFDSTTGKLIQNSGVIIDDQDNMTAVNSLEVGLVTGNGTNGLLDIKGDQGGLVGGNINISGGFGTSVGGRLTLKAGSTNSVGADVLIDGGDGPTDGGDVILNAGSSAGGMGGEVSIKGGNSLGPQPGGDVIILGGDGGSSSSIGGNMIFAGGTGGDVNGTGGGFFLLGGSGGLAGNSDGGDVNISSGVGAGTGNGGDIVLEGNGGNVFLQKTSGNVGVGTVTFDGSAILEITSASRGFLMPRMTTPERDNIASPATGLEIYNITTNEPEFFDGVDWVSTGGGGNESFAETLVIGNTTGGNDLVISSGDVIQGAPGAGPTDNGIAVNVIGGVGGATSGNGGAVFITGKDGNTNDSSGGSITIATGDGGSSSGDGGNLIVTTGSTNSGDGGDFTATLGTAGTANRTGGGFVFTPGAGTGVSPGGGFIVNGASGGPTGSGSGIVLNAGDGGATSGIGGGITLNAGAGGGSGADGIIRLLGGDVGIGTNTPSAKLTVKEDSSNVATNVVSTLINENTTASNWAEIKFSTFSSVASEVTGVLLGAQYLDHTDASIDADFVIKTTHNNILSERLRISDGVTNIVTGSLNINQGNIISPDGTSGVPINISSGDGSAGNGGNLDLISGDGFGAGGTVNLIGGDGAFSGGPININSGAASSSNSPGGTISLQSGSSSGTAAGGQVHVFGGIGGDNSGVGGQVLVHAGGGGNSQGKGGLLSLEGGQGFSSGNTDGGDVDIQGGQNFGTGIHGNVILQKTDGLVGIGTDAPEELLHLLGTNPVLKIKGDANFQQAELQLHGSRDANGAELALVRAFNFRTGTEVEVSRISTQPSGGTDSGRLKFFVKKSGDAIAEAMRIEVDGSVAIGSTPIASAILNVASVTKGFMQPRVTTTQRDAISSPADGLSVHNTTTRRPEFFDDSAWQSISVVAPQTIEIFTAADLDDLATAGVITISSQTAIILKANITTSNRFDVESGIRFTIGNNGQGYSLTYDAADTFITSIDSIIVLEASLTATGGGTLFDVSGQIGTIINLDFVLLTGWKMGTIRRTNQASSGPAVFLLHMALINWQDTLTLENVSVLTVDEIALIPFAGASVPFLEIKGDTPGSYSIDLVSGSLAAGESLIRIDPGIANSSRITISGSTMGGILFDVSGGTTGSFTAVADAFEAIPISSVIDSPLNPGTAQFQVAGGTPVVFAGQEVTLGDSTDPAYNGTHIVSQTGVGLIELEGVAFVGDAQGTFEADSITVTSTLHGLSELDTLVINTDLSTDYDEGATIYNVQTNTFQINRTFTTTHTGSWDTSGINQSDPRVLANDNPGFVSSKYIAGAFVNDNSTANGAIVNDVFTDMVFGTGGSALIAGSTSERWKIIDDVNGIFEYAGNEPFDGNITFDFTVESSGGSQDFRFKWVHDTGSGFGDLTDNVEALVNVAGDAQSITKTFPLLANKGDQIKPQITRNAGTSGITTTYATVYATQ